MAIVVEDGTGLSTAESYVTVAEADAYITRWAILGKEWPDNYLEANKEDLLKAATRYIDLVYRQRFVSRRANETQALEWPRNGWITHDFFSITSTDIPTALKEAQIEMGLAIAAGDTPFQPDFGEQVIFERNESEMTMKTVRYATPKRLSASGETIKRYPLIEQILSPLLHRPGRLDRR